MICRSSSALERVPFIIVLICIAAVCSVAQIPSRPLTATAASLSAGATVNGGPPFFCSLSELPPPMQAVLNGYRTRSLPTIGQGDPGGVWGEPDAAIYWSETTPCNEPPQEWSLYYATERYGAMIARANYNVDRAEIVTYWYGATFAHETIPVP